MRQPRHLNVPRVLATGVLVGLVVGALFSLRPPRLEQLSVATEAAFFAVVGGLVGLLVAGLVIAFVDRDR